MGGRPTKEKLAKKWDMELAFEEDHWRDPGYIFERVFFKALIDKAKEQGMDLYEAFPDACFPLIGLNNRRTTLANLAKSKKPRRLSLADAYDLVVTFNRMASEPKEDNMISFESFISRAMERTKELIKDYQEERITETSRSE